MSILTKLSSLAEPEYGDFVAKGAPSSYPVLGVRVPAIRKLAAEASDEEMLEYLENAEPKSREEVHLFSFLLARKMKKNGLNREEFFNHVSRFDSWEMVDLFCASLKFVKKAKEEWLEIIDELLLGPEFSTRMGLVLLLDYYVDAEYLEVVFERILGVKNREEYYVKMAVAWLLQKCFVYFPDLTFSFMKNAKLPEWTLRKTISKIQDSYRIEKVWKEKAKYDIIS